MNEDWQDFITERTLETVRERLVLIAQMNVQELLPKNVPKLDSFFSLQPQLLTVKRMAIELLRFIDSVGIHAFTAYQIHKEPIVRFDRVRNEVASWNYRAEQSTIESISKNDRDTLAESIYIWTYDFLNAIIPLLPHLVLSAIHTDSQTQSFRDRIEEHYHEAEKTLEGIQSLAAQAVARKHQNIFDEDATKARHGAWGWLGATIMLGLAAIGYGIAIQFGVFFPKPKELGGIIGFLGFVDPQLITYWIIGKAAFGIALILAFSFAFKSYRAARHNAVVHKHRSNSFIALEMLEKLYGRREAIHEHLLLRAADSIFAHQPTGYASDAEVSTQVTLEHVLKALIDKSK